MKKEFCKVYCVVSISPVDPWDFSVQMYNKPLFSSQRLGEWWYYEDAYNDGTWYYDFSYKPSMFEIVEVLLPKLKELGVE